MLVELYVKPDDPSNIIRLGAGGRLAVAILGSASFNARTVDP
jgi:hypothetical protein